MFPRRRRRDMVSRPSDFRLDELRGRQPALLIFAPSDRSPAFENQMRLLDDEQEGFDDAGLVIVRLLAEADSYAGGERLDDEAADRLREHFGVDRNDFSIILITREGTEVLRDDAPIQPAVLLERISENVERGT